MRTWTATTTAAAHPAAVLDVLTDPGAASRWAPVPFDVDDLDVAYELAPADTGSEVRASIRVRSGGGLTGRLLAEATGALLSAGALQNALSRIAREASVSYA